MFRFILMVALVSSVMSQAVTQPAIKRFFKYCTAANLKTATQNFNAAKNVAACNTSCSTFANGKNFIASGTKPPASDPVSQPAAAATACQAFCAHRFSVKKYVNYQFADLGSKYFTAKLAGALKAMLWQCDKASNNDFAKTSATFMPKALAKVAKDKQQTLATAVQTLTAKFNQTNPVDFKNVFGYVY